MSPSTASRPGANPVRPVSTDAAAPTVTAPLAPRVADHSVNASEAATRLSHDAAQQLVEDYEAALCLIFKARSSDLVVRQALKVQFNAAAHKKEFCVALNHCIEGTLIESGVNARLGSATATSNCMRDVGQQFAFYACVELPTADARLKAEPLDLWVTAFNWPSMVKHADRPVWMDQAAVFSHLTYSDVERRLEPWNAVTHPAWLLEKRQILHIHMPADHASIASRVQEATRMPRDLSRLSADYAAPSWDDCLAILRNAR